MNSVHFEFYNNDQDLKIYLTLKTFLSINLSLSKWIFSHHFQHFIDLQWIFSKEPGVLKKKNLQVELSCHYSKIQVCLYGVTLMDRAESCWFILPLCYLNETWPKLCYFSCILCLGFFCTNKVGEAGLLKVFATKLWLSSGSICEWVGFSDLIDLKGESVMPDIW